MEEENKLDPQTVFKISHKDIEATGKTQCLNHKWKKLNDNELECPCGTVIIINPETINEYVHTDI